MVYSCNEKTMEFAMKKQDPAALESICRQQGLRLTHQRKAILTALAGRSDHPTADQLYDEIQAVLPEVSRTTVYRVLEKLVAAGVARTVCHPGPTARYEALTARHHHLVCRRCSRLTDIAASALNDLPLPSTRGFGFKIDDYSIQFMGICAECNKKV
jgi:Fur family peroxide stress response transcriptional regulator